jgi:hypothetical protein
MGCAAPRPNKKAQKLLEKIIGVPVNMLKVRMSAEQKRIRALLLAQDGRMSR